MLLPELKEKGKTVIAITYDDEYYKLCDRVIKFNYGKVDPRMIILRTIFLTGKRVFYSMNKINLFCLPYVGGSRSAYYQYIKISPNDSLNAFMRAVLSILYFVSDISLFLGAKGARQAFRYEDVRRGLDNFYPKGSPYNPSV